MWGFDLVQLTDESDRGGFPSHNHKIQVGFIRRENAVHGLQYTGSITWAVVHRQYDMGGGAVLTANPSRPGLAC